MSKIFYHKELGPQLFADDAARPSGADWLETAEEYAAWLKARQPEPPLPSLADLRLAKLAEINSKYEAAIAWLKSPYPDMSLIFWDRQCQEAREYLADAAAPALYIRELAAAKGLEVGELASRILAYEEDWAPIGGRLEGQRQLYEEAALEAETPEDIAGITVSYNF